MADKHSKQQELSARTMRVTAALDSKVHLPSNALLASQNPALEEKPLYPDNLKMAGHTQIATVERIPLMIVEDHQNSQVDPHELPANGSSKVGLIVVLLTLAASAAAWVTNITRRKYALRELKAHVQGAPILAPGGTQATTDREKGPKLALVSKELRDSVMGTEESRQAELTDRIQAYETRNQEYLAGLQKEVVAKLPPIGTFLR